MRPRPSDQAICPSCCWPCALLLLPLLGAACGGGGTYALSWTIGCADAAEGEGCEVRSAKDCSQLGLAEVEVVAQQGSGGGTRVTFPCYSVIFGARGSGPELDAGQTTLTVAGLAAGGYRLSGPVSLVVEIPESGEQAASVVLPRPLPCGDGADNDADGLVDWLDPGCTTSDGTSE